MSKIVKIALDAGHSLNTPGKRCDVRLDPKETREWYLNSRIAKKVQDSLLNYKDVKTLRVDDTTGKNDIPLGTRCYDANKWNADLYCSFHHDASPDIFDGGGLTVYTYDESNQSQILRNLLYNCLIENGAIKGNRSQPLRSSGFYVLANTAMKAVLVEHGFMTSSVDVPIILTDEYAEKIAKGWIDFFERYFVLEKKPSTITYGTGRHRLSKKLSIRQGPSVTSKKLGTVNKDTIITVIRIANIKWGYVPEYGGYISLRYCIPNYKLGKYKLNKALNLRQGAAKTTKKIKGIKKNTEIEVTQIQNGQWGYCKNLKGWICLKYCTYMD